MEVLPSEQQSPQAKDTRKREREDSSSGSRVTKRVRKANSRYQEYEVPKAQKGSADGNGENTTPTTPKTPKSRVTTTPSKEGGGKRIEFAVTSGKKKIEIAVTPRKNGGLSVTTPTTPKTPTPTTPAQPQSGRAKRSKAMRRQKTGSDFYRGGRSSELSPPLKHCQKILTKLMAHNCAWPFNKPVDPISLCIPDYFDIIKFPMDLGTIQEQLGNGFYENIDDFAEDIRLVWKNAFTYNKATSDVCIMATELSTLFEAEFKKVDPEEQPPAPEPVTPAPAARKRTPNSRAKATPAAVPKATPDRSSAKSKPAPKPKTPKKEETVAKPKTTKRAEEEKKTSSQKKRSNPKASAEDSQTRQLQRELQRMRKKMDGLQQQIQCVTANPKPAQKKRQQPVVRQMNRDEKRRLSEKINSLPGKYLGEVVRIIQESISIRDDDAPPPEEIEIDMDALGNSTLRKLESFVDECLSKKKNPIVPIPQPAEGAQNNQNGQADDPMGVQSDEESDTDSDSYTESEDEEEEQASVDSGLPLASSTPSQTPPHPSPVTPVSTPTPPAAPSPVVVPASSPAVSSPTTPSGLSVSSVLPISNGQKGQPPASKLSSSSTANSAMRKSSGSLSFLESLNSLKSLGSSKGSPLGSSQSISSPTISSPTPTTPSEAPKSEEKVVINEKGWSQLNGGDKKEGEEKVESKENGDGSLWSEFREKDQQKQQKEKELKDKEEEERKAWIAQQEQLRKEEEQRQREREEAEQQRIREEEEAAERAREQRRQQEKLEREKKAADAALQNEHCLMMTEFETGVDGFAT